MPSENVLEDRRKKAKLAKTARIGGTGYRKGMAPDFVYSKGEPSIPQADSTKDTQVARLLFELQRQRVPGIFPPEKDFKEYDTNRTPQEVELVNAFITDLQKRHSGLYNPYKKKKIYEPFTYNEEQPYNDPEVLNSKALWEKFLREEDTFE